MKRIFSLKFIFLTGVIIAQNNSGDPNCLGYPNQMVCCDGSKQATVDIIESETELKSSKIYEKVKNELKNIDFANNNLILVSAGDLPFSQKVETVSLSVNWKEEFYRKMQVKCNKDILLNYKFMQFEHVFWKVVTKEVKGETQCSCSVNSTENKKGDAEKTGSPQKKTNKK